MQIRQLGLGLGAFAAGAAAWIWGSSRYGDRVGQAIGPALARRTAPTGDPSRARPDASAAASMGADNAGTSGRGSEADAGDGHVPTDLLADAPVTIDTRAPDAFRPDPTAVPTDAEKEALRPATGPAPTLAADRGSGVSDAAGAA